MKIAKKHHAQNKLWLVPQNVIGLDIWLFWQIKLVVRVFKNNQNLKIWASPLVHDAIHLYVAHIQLIILYLQATWRLTSYYPWSLDLLGLINIPFQIPGEHVHPYKRFVLVILLSYIISISIPPGEPTHSHLSKMKHVGAQH